MNGVAIGSLKLYAGSVLKWTRSGPQGSSWLTGVATLDGATSFTFEGTRGTYFSPQGETEGDIAVDIVTVACVTSPSPPPPPPSPLSLIHI